MSCAFSVLTHWIVTFLKVKSTRVKEARRDTNLGMKNSCCWSHPLDVFLFLLIVCLSTLHALCHDGATVFWMLVLIQAWVCPVVVVGSNAPFPCPKNERREDRHTNCWSDWSRITVTIVLNSIHYYFVSSSSFFLLQCRCHAGLLLIRSTTC